MISIGAAANALTISSTRGAMLGASLRAGTTTEMCGRAAPDAIEVASLIQRFPLCFPAGYAAATGPRGCDQTLRKKLPLCAEAFLARMGVLLGDEGAGNPLDPPPGGARQRLGVTIRSNEKAETAGREPIAHQQRAERPERRPGDHVPQTAP